MENLLRLSEKISYISYELSILYQCDYYYEDEKRYRAQYEEQQAELYSKMQEEFNSIKASLTSSELAKAESLLRFAAIEL